MLDELVPKHLLLNPSCNLTEHWAFFMVRQVPKLVAIDFSLVTNLSLPVPSLSDKIKKSSKAQFRVRLVLITILNHRFFQE